MNTDAKILHIFKCQKWGCHICRKYGILGFTNLTCIFILQTRMQWLMPDPWYNYHNMADAFTKIIKYEGICNTMWGINAMVGGARPRHTMYFACYEKMKMVLSRGGPQNAIHHGNNKTYKQIMIQCMYEDFSSKKWVAWIKSRWSAKQTCN